MIRKAFAAEILKIEMLNYGLFLERVPDGRWDFLYPGCSKPSKMALPAVFDLGKSPAKFRGLNG